MLFVFLVLSDICGRNASTYLFSFYPVDSKEDVIVMSKSHRVMLMFYIINTSSDKCDNTVHREVESTSERHLKVLRSYCVAFTMSQLLLSSMCDRFFGCWVCSAPLPNCPWKAGMKGWPMPPNAAALGPWLCPWPACPWWQLSRMWLWSCRTKGKYTD